VVLIVSSLSAAVLVACGGGNDGVTYTRDVEPLFARRCVPCHFSANKDDLVDLEDPFSADETPGAINFVSTWGVGPREIDIVPYDPEASFILRKVTDVGLKPDACGPETPDCPRAKFGGFMPMINLQLTDEEKAAIRQWILDGALEAGWGAIAPYFGTHAEGFKDQPGPQILAPEKCAFCHYTGSPDPPDFSQPFDPVVGLVGVRSSYRSDRLRVAPGDPDASFLVTKVEATEGSSEHGSPMPRNYEALSEAEVDVLRSWILAGARKD